MDNLKQIIARNMAQLRVENGLTQLELAQKLNYSDKAVSKWERGESLPDVAVLKNIADLFNVTLDYLVTEEHNPPAEKPVSDNTASNHSVRNKAIVSLLAILITWSVAILGFIIFDSFSDNIFLNLLPFAYAVPVTLIVWLVFNSIWFNQRRNYLIISLLMWSVLLIIFLTIALFSARMMWTVFLLGIPGQAAVFLWSKFKLNKD